MDYVFFDIECANCIEGQAKICSFGYVVTDEQFDVIEREDLIVNPKAPFLLSGRKNRPFIQLAYSKAEFKKAPTFPYVYDNESISDNIERLRGYSEDIIPVLDNENDRLLGVITSKDIIEIVDAEISDDYAKLAALSSEEEAEEQIVNGFLK